MTRLLKLVYLFFICSLLIGGQVKMLAQAFPEELSPEAKMSVLVASPSSKEVYTMYGHVGYRVQDAMCGLDVTFNYGIFQFDEDFILRFLGGRTDYLVLPQYTVDYMQEYLSRGSYVDEIQLNLSVLEKDKVWKYLIWNIDSTNRVYRYHFFKDNCATRPLWLVDMGVGGLTYTAELPKGRTWRDEINELEASNPWLVLGTDLALGVPTDSVMRGKDYAFSPRWIRPLLEGAKRSDGSSIVSAVIRHGDQGRLVEGEGISLLTPVSLMLLLLSLVLWGYVYRLLVQGRGVLWGIDALSFASLGVAGVFLYYIACLSEHPFVWVNYNLWVLNPLHLLIGLPLMTLRRWRSWAVCYHFVTFVSVSVFIVVAIFLPQHFNGAIYILALSLGLMSLGRVVAFKRSQVS